MSDWCPTFQDNAVVSSSEVEISNHAWHDPFRVKFPMVTLEKDDGNCMKYSGS
jgi:hypothetical protein